MTEDPKARFTGRASVYSQYRPSYPIGANAVLQELGIGPGRVVADVGCGTGIFSQLLLDVGATVIGVEPNDEMRLHAQKGLGRSARFDTVHAPAEATTLSPQSVDFVTAAQAFHWFDVDRTRPEFRRILRPNGFAILVWNTRVPGLDGFSSELEGLLASFGRDYASIGHRGPAREERLSRFFRGEGKRTALSHSQTFEKGALEGWLASVSYLPRHGDANYTNLWTEVCEAFARHESRGMVQIDYQTDIYWGRPGE